MIMPLSSARSLDRPSIFVRMKAGALHWKSMPEILEQIKDWPTEMKRALVETVQHMLAEGSKPKPDPTKKRLGTMDAYGAWVGPETAEELIAMIKGARTENPDRDPL